MCPDIMQELAEKHVILTHNYYIQMLAETGVVGFIRVYDDGAILWKAGTTSWQGRGHVIAATAVIVPLGSSFPYNPQQIFLANGIIFLCGARSDWC